MAGGTKGCGAKGTQGWGNIQLGDKSWGDILLRECRAEGTSGWGTKGWGDILLGECRAEIKSKLSDFKTKKSTSKYF